jgi:hypothetical protein
MAAKAIQKNWAVRDRLAVCVHPDPYAQYLIARAARMARRLDAEFFAVYVDTGPCIAWKKMSSSISRNSLAAETSWPKHIPISSTSIWCAPTRTKKIAAPDKSSSASLRAPRWNSTCFPSTGLLGLLPHRLRRIRCAQADLILQNGLTRKVLKCRSPVEGSLAVALNYSGAREPAYLRHRRRGRKNENAAPERELKSAADQSSSAGAVERRNQ